MLLYRKALTAENSQCTRAGQPARMHVCLWRVASPSKEATGETSRISFLAALAGFATKSDELTAD